jgi:hypothetical protein
MQLNFNPTDLTGFLIEFSSLSRAAMPKVSGAFIFGLGRAAKSVMSAKVYQLLHPKTFGTALKEFTSAYKPLFKKFDATFEAGKVFKTAKSLRSAYNFLGIVDVLGDLVVTSDLDKTIFGFLPGAGLLELAATVVNAFTGMRLLNARFILIG